MAKLKATSTTGRKHILNELNFTYNLSNYPTLKDAIIAIGGEEATLFIPRGQWDVGGAVVPENVTLCFDRGALFVGDFAIYGSIEAGSWQIFSGDVTGELIDRQVNANWFGPKVFGVVDLSSSLSKMVSLIGTNEGTILFSPARYRLGRDTRIPSNIHMKFEYGAVLNVVRGKVLEINGLLDAGVWQIFSGDGTIRGRPKISEVYPEWFGAEGNGNVDSSSDSGITGTNDYLAIMKAIRFANLIDELADHSHTPVVIFQAKTYALYNGIELPGLPNSPTSSYPVRLKGTIGPRDVVFSTLLFSSKVANGITWPDAVVETMLIMENMYIRKPLPSAFNRTTCKFVGAAPTGNGIKGNHLIKSSIRECRFDGWGNGIKLQFAYYSELRGIFFYNCETCFNSFSGGLNGTILDACRFGDSVTGLKLTNASFLNTIVGCYFETLTDGAIIQNSGAVSIYNSWFEFIVGKPIKFNRSLNVFSSHFDVRNGDNTLVASTDSSAGIDTNVLLEGNVVIGVVVGTSTDAIINMSSSHDSVLLINNSYFDTDLNSVDVSVIGSSKISRIRDGYNRTNAGLV